MSNYSLVLPVDFDDYEWEVTAKGYFSEAQIIAFGRRCQVNFYDPTRLNQEVKNNIQRGQIFFKPNLIVVEAVTRKNMKQATDFLSKSNQMGFLFNQNNQ